MEADEGTVKIYMVPSVTIGDKPLSDCSTPAIAREIQRLCRVIASQREAIQRLTAKLDAAS